MGHRANFIEIKNGTAKAYEDNWAALGATFLFASGLKDACHELKGYRETDELMDWAFAEAGYLIDHDDKVAIAFGIPEPLDDLLEEDDVSGASNDLVMDMLFEEDYEGFLKGIAKGWPGWRLIWDDRGVDAFSEYLAQKGYKNIKCAEVSYPPDTKSPHSHQA